jgi:hypothetical protein
LLIILKSSGMWRCWFGDKLWCVKGHCLHRQGWELLALQYVTSCKATPSHISQTGSSLFGSKIMHTSVVGHVC